MTGQETDNRGEAAGPRPGDEELLAPEDLEASRARWTSMSDEELKKEVERYRGMVTSVAERLAASGDVAGNDSSGSSAVVESLADISLYSWKLLHYHFLGMVQTATGCSRFARTRLRALSLHSGAAAG